MAAQRGARAVEKKGRSKKRKSRTEVSSSESSSDSSSESEVEQKKSRKSPSSEEESSESTAEPTPTLAKKAKKQKAQASTATTQNDVSGRQISSSPVPAPTSAAVKPQSKIEEDFDSIYIRKITTELADDLDKVRSAQDFKANSIPMLIHALKQGESLFSSEEKRRVVATTKA